MGIEVVGVSKNFGSVVAVREFHLHARRGELLTIVGPSGCGKTTLLRVMAGLEEADAGQVLIGGHPATRLPPERRSVGFVFQQFALFPNMNVHENIAYGLRRQRMGRPERRQRVAELLALIGMAGYGERRADELSAGQQQRVALARALAPEPDILLLDEPLSALDAAIRYQLRDELRNLLRRVGITTIMVTHDQEEALDMADRVAVMHEGRLEQVGTPWEIYDKPRTQFVARFVGRGNFLRGQRRLNEVHVPALGVAPLASSRREAGVGAAGGRPRSGTQIGSQTRPPTDAWSTDRELPKLRIEPVAGPGGPTGGRPVTVLIRPESVFIAPDPRAGEGGAFIVSAVVEDIRFGGEKAYAHLRLADSEGGFPTAGGRGGEVILAALSGSDIPRIASQRKEQVTIIIPHSAMRLLHDS